MENTQQNQSRIAEGFSFYTLKDAKLAQNEANKVRLLESKIDYSKPDAILRVYDKAVSERLFRTPVGLIFLKKLQDYLHGRTDIEQEKVVPIPLFHTFDEDVRTESNPARKRVRPSEKKENEKSGYRISVILNILLILAVLAMFWITLNADQPNILNYETALKNRYAAWEQELTEREQTIREKERAYMEEETSEWNN
ncbi:MAG: hypothetical protein K6G30_06850 [Acetatifactor sp.]|nr:hypothetical protein [Acetatifactor sp.]